MVAEAKERACCLGRPIPSPITRRSWLFRTRHRKVNTRTPSGRCFRTARPIQRRLAVCNTEHVGLLRIQQMVSRH